MNQASVAAGVPPAVAAGVPPAVEGGVSPPGIPGSWPVSRSFLNRGLPMNRKFEPLIFNVHKLSGS